jgi:acetolactate synthase I/III small subunit
MKHTISVLVENHFGALARIAGLFSARGFNIDSLAVGETEDPSISRMTIVVKGDENILEQVMKQLNKLIDVIKVFDLKDSESVKRDLILVKVNADKNNRSQILQIVDIFKAKIIEASNENLIIEFSGEEEKIDSILNMLKPFGIKELVRTGTIAVAK